MIGNLVRLDENLHKQVKKYCEENGYTFTGLVRVLLKERICGKS